MLSYPDITPRKNHVCTDRKCYECRLIRDAIIDFAHKLKAHNKTHIECEKFCLSCLRDQMYLDFKYIWQCGQYSVNLVTLWYKINERRKYVTDLREAQEWFITHLFFVCEKRYMRPTLHGQYCRRCSSLQADVDILITKIKLIDKDMFISLSATQSSNQCCSIM